MRRAAHEAFTKVAVQRYHPIQTKEATILVSALLATPENRDQHIQRTAASAIMSITYDYPTLTTAQDKAVRNLDRNIHSGARAAAGTSLVEYFPWMIHVPQRSMFSPQYFITAFHSHLKDQQVCEVEEGSLEASCRAFNDIFRIIQSC